MVHNHAPCIHIGENVECDSRRRNLLPADNSLRPHCLRSHRGLACEITGGKFANGAITASFAHLFNDEDILHSHGGNPATQSLAANDGDKSLFQCFASCTWDYYRIANALPRIFGIAVSAPLSKPWLGLPTLGDASPFTNLISYFGFLVDAINVKLPFKFLGTQDFGEC